MKKIFVILFIAIIGLGVNSVLAQNDTIPQDGVVENVKKSQIEQTNSDALWSAANQAFMDGQYPKAVADYEAILSRGEYSSKLFFNLGNAYFQQNRLGKAILNYTRAYNLDPSDDDIVYNLELARSRTKDKIEPVPQFVVVRWLATVGNLLDSDGWAIISLIMFGVCVLGILIWLRVSSVGLQKIGFFASIISGVLFVVTLAYSIRGANMQFDENAGVIINSAAPVKSAPSSGGKDLFVLHEGTAVEVLQTLDGWSEVRLADGNKGWLSSDAVEMLH